MTKYEGGENEKVEITEDGIYEHKFEVLYEDKKLSVYRGYNNQTTNQILWTKIDVDELGLTEPMYRDDLQKNIDLGMNVSHYLRTWWDKSKSNRVDVLSEHIPGNTLRQDLDSRKCGSK